MNKQLHRKEWFDYRDRIIERDNDMCARCGRGSADNVVLQVHHKQYISGKKPWEYPEDLCETLCRGCHAAEHGKIPPKTGWEFLFEDDLEDLSGICEFCGTELRYVFYIQHPEWGVMEVGTDCCDNLTGTEIAVNQRRFRNRKKAFVNSTRWKSSANGYEISQKKFNVSIVAELSGYRIFINGHKGGHIYETLEDAKEKVFEVIENGSAKRYVEEKTA